MRAYHAYSRHVAIVSIAVRANGSDTVVPAPLPPSIIIHHYLLASINHHPIQAIRLFEQTMRSFLTCRLITIHY